MVESSKEGESVGWMLAAVLRKADESELGHALVEVVILLLARSQSDTFLTAAGERGWELATTLVPFAPGKKLYARPEAEEDTSYFKNALDIQSLIFKREM